MSKFNVLISNGAHTELKEIAKDGEWVNSPEDAFKMAEAMLNKSWKVLKVSEDADYKENMSKKDIALQFAKFEDMCEALDTCFDLHDLGCCDKVTQDNYIELTEMKVLETWAVWMKAHDPKFQ